jgi:hypothetical protein
MASKEDEEQALEGSSSKVLGPDGDSKKPDDPLATWSEVFSFMPNTKTKVYFGTGILVACFSGCIFPAMAFLFSSSFEDLSGATCKLER